MIRCRSNLFDGYALMATDSHPIASVSSLSLCQTSGLGTPRDRRRGLRFQSFLSFVSGKRSAQVRWKSIVDALLEHPVVRIEHRRLHHERAGQCECCFHLPQANCGSLLLAAPAPDQTSRRQSDRGPPFALGGFRASGGRPVVRITRGFWGGPPGRTTGRRRERGPFPPRLRKPVRLPRSRPPHP